MFYKLYASESSEYKFMSELRSDISTYGISPCWSSRMHSAIYTPGSVLKLASQYALVQMAIWYRCGHSVVYARRKTSVSSMHPSLRFFIFGAKIKKKTELSINDDFFCKNQSIYKPI